MSTLNKLTNADKKELLKMYQEALNRAMHFEIQTNMQWNGYSNEKVIREANEKKLDDYKKLLKYEEDKEG